MALLDLFRPKWKHSDPAVRAEAVRDMEDTATLRKVAESDPEARVRRLAIKKIDDPATLQALAGRDPDEALRKAAGERAIELWLSAALAAPPKAGARAKVSESEEGEDSDASTAPEALEAEALAAVTALPGDAHKTLLEIAQRAAFPAVRAAAAERLGEPRALCELARSSNDAPLRRAAVEKLARQRAVEALCDVAVAEKTVRDVGLLAVEKLAGQRAAAELAEVAEKSPTRDVALAALEQVADLDSLATIGEKARHKAVRAAARAKLPAESPAQASQGATPAPRRPGGPSEQELIRRARMLQLARAAEAASGLAELGQAEAGLEEARRGWAEIQPAPQPQEESSKRFARAEQQVKARREAAARRAQQQAAAQAEAARKAQAEDERGAVRLGLCERVERLTGPELPAQLEALRAEWAALGEVPKGSQRLEQRFERALEDAERRHRQADGRRKAAQRLQALVTEAEGLNGTGPEVRERLKTLWREWEKLTSGRPGETARLAEEVDLKGLSARLGRVRDGLESRVREDAARQQAEAEAVVQRIQALNARLKEAVASDDRKKVDAALKEAREALGGGRGARGAGPAAKPVLDELAALRDQLSRRAQELYEAEDWKRWANVPRLEALVARVEALGAQEDAAAAQKELKTLQAEWKTVGPAPKEKSEALWARFKAAGDAVYQRAQAHFSVQREARAEVLGKKEALVARAEALAVAPVGEGQPTLKERGDELKKLQAEWKALGPVAREQQEAGEALWKRFRAVCDQFFGQRKQEAEARDEERAANLKRQEDMVARAEALADAPAVNDWKAAADRLKRLQEDWKRFSATPRDQKEAADANWKRFRAACDRFFERRQVYFAAQDAERQGNLAKKLALCEEVEGLVKSEEFPGEDDTVGMVKGFMAAWKEIGPVPRAENEPIWQRFREACDKLRERRWQLPEVQDATRFEHRPFAQHLTRPPEGDAS